MDIHDATISLSLSSLQPIDRPVQLVAGECSVAEGQVITAGETQGSVAAWHSLG